MMLFELGAHARAIRTPTQMKIDGLRHWVIPAKRDLEEAIARDAGNAELTKLRRRLARFENPLKRLESVERIAAELAGRKDYRLWTK